MVPGTPCCAIQAVVIITVYCMCGNLYKLTSMELLSDVDNKIH